ncbi:anti sigma factor C-terminal domain-containing protein [Solibacillus cecembensis]|uniref:anti-sigma factor n=1 Tax=Solibacillus cecembensis TaxID=459347 RepID=UPI003D08EDD9
MDPYEQFIQKAKKESKEMDEHSAKKTFKAIRSSKWKLILTTVIVILLIVPTCFMLTIFYYAFGTKSTTLMDITSQTQYITEPNITLEELQFEMDFSLFTMKLDFIQYKQIGKDIYPVKEYETSFLLNNLMDKKIDSKLEKMYPKYPTQTSPWLVHPKNQYEFNSANEWWILEGLPDETVVEAYISLNELTDVEQVQKLFENVDVTWAAVYTGLEEKNESAEGIVSPIGYPVGRDTTNWSPFKDSVSHEQTFLEILEFLAPYERIATDVSSHKTLSLQERIEYVKKHGFQTYAVVVTGPKAEVEKLQKNEIVRLMKLGEVKLWNWVN